MKSVSLLQESTHGPNLNEFSIEDASHWLYKGKTVASHFREKRRATRDNLGFCAGTESGQCRTSEREFAWETGRRKQAVMGKLVKPAPSRPLRERRGALHCCQPRPRHPVTRSASPTFTARETGTANLRKVLCCCLMVHSLLPIKMFWM